MFSLHKRQVTLKRNVDGKLTVFILFMFFLLSTLVAGVEWKFSRFTSTLFFDWKTNWHRQRLGKFFFLPYFLHDKKNYQLAADPEIDLCLTTCLEAPRPRKSWVMALLFLFVARLAHVSLFSVPIAVGTLLGWLFIGRAARNLDRHERDVIYLMPNESLLTEAPPSIIIIYS